MIFGPQPRWATKWGWFWLYSTPAWLGLITALVVEKPWSGRRETGQKRVNGWQGFLIVLLAWLIGSALLSILLGS